MERTCTGPCATPKSLEEFPRDRRRKDGHASECKECGKARYHAKPKISPIMIGEWICYGCCELKPVTEFPKHPRMKDGRSHYCKRPCALALQKVRKNDEEAWWNVIGPERQSDPNYRRNWALFRRFKITLEQYNKMLSAQDGTCAFCERSLEDSGRALSVDHDRSCCPGEYSCGKCVRWILCNRHNNAIGLFDDDVVVLRRAADLLEEWQATFHEKSHLPS